MSTAHTHADTLIIGAGLSGLMAARTLKASDVPFTILDKGVSVGGRMATRRIGPGLADHGAQFFSVRTPEFQHLVDAWLSSGLVFLWSRGWSSGSLQPPTDQGYPRYAVNGGMNALTKHLAEDVKSRVYLNRRVDSIAQQGEKWLVHEAGGGTYTADKVVITAPVPQALELLQNGGVALAKSDHEALSRIEYEPCLTAMYWVSSNVELPNPGAIQRRDAPISWIANNRQKGISDDATVITVQANGTYSTQLWDAPDDRVLSALKTDLRVYLPEGAEFRAEELKRWRYAMPTEIYPEPYLRAEGLPPLFFAGDAFGGPRVEGAILSGLAVGKALTEAE